MTKQHEATLARLVSGAIGAEAGAALMGVVRLDPAVGLGGPASASRAQVAMALNLVLFHALLGRTPTAAAYVSDLRRSGRRFTFDHGAMRTVRFPDEPTGALPPGRDAFARILRPLGYREAEVYPLDRLRMTGYVFRHADFPETVPQFFVSELHADRFTPDFQAAARRVFGTAEDRMGALAHAALAQLDRYGSCPTDVAAAALRPLAGLFGRTHESPAVCDYETLLAESAEAAWIATEGSTFNHATDRVDDLEAVVAEQRALGRPMKDAIEVSASGRIRQTAFRADPALRPMWQAPRVLVERQVPGSFYEFITRARREDGSLDLGFDSGNAQGIFRMTEAAA